MYHPIPSNLSNTKGSYDNHTTYTEKLKKKDLKLISKKCIEILSYHENIIHCKKKNLFYQDWNILFFLKKIGNNIVQNKWSKTYIQEMNIYISIPWKYK